MQTTKDDNEKHANARSESNKQCDALNNKQRKTHHTEVDELDVGGGVGERLLHPGRHEPLDLAGLQRDQLADGFLVLLQRASAGAADL